MTPAKRLFDLGFVIPLGLFLSPLIVLIIVVLLVVEGRPVLYIGERMATPTRAFGLIKFRTMRPDAHSTGVTGADKNARMSGLHRLLRRTRADELPQIWNVIRGDMSLVGPRPPLRIYVQAFPDLYTRVLHSRPGVTGLASLAFHTHEERILATCHTAAQTDAVYRRRCVPRKARLDLIYQQRRTLCFDLWLVMQTAARPFRRKTHQKTR